MARNSGKDIDATSYQVRDRDGVTYAVDRMELADSGLYYARPLIGWDVADYHELWALPDQGWVVNKGHVLPGAAESHDWYLEPDLITIDGGIWSIRDAYLDVKVYDGVRYEVCDAGELADGLSDGAISVEDATAALRALGTLLAVLERNGCSGAALLSEFAPGLPVPREVG